MRLESYLQRIGYTGPLAVNLETLNSIHRHHLMSIPYENLDVQLNCPLTTDVAEAFDKIVNKGRGGWCYEMNGVLGWALAEIGFDIRRVSGGVNRRERGDGVMGSHLVLLATLDKPYIVDAGFGDGFLNPIPLKEGKISERGFEFKLEKLADGYWRLHNHQYGGAPDFDFNTKTADEAELGQLCQVLQSFEQSPFVTWLIAQRFTQDGYEIQVGQTSKTITAKEVITRTVQSLDELQTRLRDIFGLDVPDVARLWPTIRERHQQLIGDK